MVCKRCSPFSARGKNVGDRGNRVFDHLARGGVVWGDPGDGHRGPTARSMGSMEGTLQVIPPHADRALPWTWWAFFLWAITRWLWTLSVYLCCM